MSEPIPIPYEEGDELLHDDDHPFCPDQTCPCHEDGELTDQVQGWYADGLISAEDADRIYRGQII